MINYKYKYLKYKQLYKNLNIKPKNGGSTGEEDPVWNRMMLADIEHEQRKKEVREWNISQSKKLKNIKQFYKKNYPTLTKKEINDKAMLYSLHQLVDPPSHSYDIDPITDNPNWKKIKKLYNAANSFKIMNKYNLGMSSGIPTRQDLHQRMLVNRLFSSERGPTNHVINEYLGRPKPNPQTDKAIRYRTKVSKNRELIHN